MSQTIDRGTLDRLIALGRDRGELSADDLRAALPVEHLDVDDLVLVMLELESAGISVEPEAFGPPADKPLTTALILPPRDPRPVPPVRAGEGADAAAAPTTASGSPPAPPPQADPDDGARINRAVALAGLATLLILGTLLLLL